MKGAVIKQGVVQHNIMQTGARGEAPRVAQKLYITNI